MDVILATANQDKVREIREILPDGLIRFRTMREAGFCDPILENGLSFAENALIKARTVHQRTGGYVLADDSGLTVDVLDGAPGINSARFAGEQAGYPEKIARLHEMLRPWPPERWQASFVCVIALIRPDGREVMFRGECRGQIARNPRGSNGFGYDPIFWLPERQMTMAELPPAEKHLISHRGQALRAAADFLRKEMPVKAASGLDLAELLRRLADQPQVTVLVFADSHGQNDFMVSQVRRYPDTDLVLHLGDHCADLADLAAQLGKPVLGVAGNCDIWSGRSLPGQQLLVLAGRRLFLAHGHQHQVKRKLSPLLAAATGEPYCADIILFGHTHQYLDKVVKVADCPVMLLNPGSARRNPFGQPASGMRLRLGGAGSKCELLLDQT